MARDISRRTLLATGGAGAIAAAVGLGGGFLAGAPARDHRTARAQTVLGTLAGHFYDPAGRHIRPTDGGGPRNGLVDDSLATPSLWQMESFENALFNDWTYLGGPLSREKLIDQWQYVQSVTAFAPRVLAGDGAGRTIFTFDDAVWQGTYLMHAHIATGDPRALAYLALLIPATTRRFADPDTRHNPPIRYADGFVAPTYGCLYTEIDNPSFKTYGKVSSMFEAGLALLAVYVHERSGTPGALAYARHSYDWMRDRLRTPDPSDPPPRGAQAPATPGARKAADIYECQLNLNAAGGTGQDPGAPFLAPDQGFFGKPVRNLDSTYLGGALMMAVLGARLFRLTGDDRYRRDAVATAAAIVRPNAYGRTVAGRTLIANTRDPHSEGHWLLPFAAETLALPGAPAATRQAIIDTADHMLAHCLTPDGYVTADWAGPERDPFGAGGRGTDLWAQDYAANPGSLGGPRQIMTSSESLCMIQAGAYLGRRA